MVIKMSVYDFIEILPLITLAILFLIINIPLFRWILNLDKEG